MDDATTVFATACAVIAASTGMVLCFAPKNVDDAIVEEKDMAVSEDKATVLEETAALTEEIVKKEVSPEPILSEEPVTSNELPANDIATAVVTVEDVPEQRPVDPSETRNETDSPTKKKRRFTLRAGDRRSQRVVDDKSSTAKPVFSKSQSMKWLPFRSGNNKKRDVDAVNVGPEI